MKYINETDDIKLENLWLVQVRNNSEEIVIENSINIYTSNVAIFTDLEPLLENRRYILQVEYIEQCALAMKSHIIFMNNHRIKYMPENLNLNH